MSENTEVLRRALSGISGILVTPFDREDRIAVDRLPPIIDRAIRAGVHILVTNGNTGEFYALTADEAERMVLAVAERADGRVPVIGGVGRSVHEACALAKVSRRAGVSALMLHQPPDPFVSPRGLVDYVKRVADAGQDLPVMLYLRNDGIGLPAIEALCRIPQVAGIKWACPTPIRLGEAIARCDPRLVWVCDLAETWAPAFYAVGARGFTSGLINLWPEQSMAIHAALESGDYPAARKAIAVIAEFETIRAEEQNGVNVAGVKAALLLSGEDCGAARPPAGWPLSDVLLERMRSLLRSWPELSARMNNR